MLSNIFIEKDLAEHHRAKSILSHFANVPVTVIDRYDDYWGKFKKPYLLKRENLNLYVARKKGNLVKEAPDSYGVSGEPHYYFIHAYNCIYECQYCYLQGYFKTPDLVLFVNHEDILSEMESILQQHQRPVWFHAGEFSDSLALSHITGELPLYFDFFKKRSTAFLELRTKSCNVKEFKSLEPLANIVVSFSLSPGKVAKRIDIKTASVSSRLKAMVSLKDMGFSLAIHLDPIVYSDTLESDYQELFQELRRLDLVRGIRYVSMGVVRFTKDAYREVERNYPDSVVHTQPMVASFDGKVRYNHPMRSWILNRVKQLSFDVGFTEKQIYFCMESN